MMLRSLPMALLALLLALWSPLHAQSPPAELVDRVVAIAGDSIILLSEIEEEIFRLEARGMPVPENPVELQALRAELVDALVNQLLIVQAAQADTTLIVDEDELERLASAEIDQRVRRAGTQAAFQQQLAAQGFSVSSYREFLKSQARRERLQELFLRKTQAGQAPVLVDEEEVRAAWELQKDQIPPLPAQVNAYQVVVEPAPSDSARRAARETAEELLAQIRAGEDFETLARRFSQDPGSAQAGGDLGWFRRGVMVPPFEDAAFRMLENQVSDVVETDFGAHIIKVERIRGGERKARHILIRAEVTPADREVARTRAAELRRRVDGGETLESLKAEFGMSGMGALPDSLAAPLDQLEQLPPAYAVLATANPGDILGPLEFELQGNPFFAVLRVTERRAAGPRTFEDVRDQLRARLQEEKALERILTQLRERSFVEIRL